MKLVLISDLHFGIHNDSEIFLEHQRNFFEEQLFPYIMDQKIKNIVILGDMFDRRKYTNHQTIHFLKNNFFDALKKMNITVHSIMGNHDVALKSTNSINSPNLLLREYENIIYYSHPHHITFDTLKILMMPWINPENQTELYGVMNKSSAPIMLGHFELKDEELRRDFKFANGVLGKEVSRFERVISGHYHHKFTKGNFTYLGTPYQLDNSDIDSDKGFHILDTETRSLTFIKNHKTLFESIVWDDHLTEKEIDNLDPNFFTKKYIKIKVKKKNKTNLFEKYLTTIENFNPYDISLDETEATLDDKVEIKSTDDTLSVFKKHINAISEFNEKKKQLIYSTIDETYHEAFKYIF